MHIRQKMCQQYQYVRSLPRNRGESATSLRERGERYVLGVPCTTTIRDLEAPSPEYSGRGRPPKPRGNQ